jgi:hypothetical protein
VRALSRPWLAVAALVLSHTLHLSDGFYHEPTLAWLGLALAAAVLGIAGVSWPWGADDVQDVMTRGLLKAGVIVSAVSLVTKPLARYMADPRPWMHPALLIAVAVVVFIALGVKVAHGAAARRRAAIVIAAVGLWLGAWTVRESPQPHIDVIPVHVDAFGAVARGDSPYGITFTDMYRANESFYSPEMRDGKRVLFGFPYPPLSLLLAWPGHALLGDLRYSEALALVVAITLMLWMGGDVGILCGAALLLAPRLVFHLEQGWTEPFPIMLLALTVATALRRPSLAWLPLGLLIASKQHMVLALAFVPMLVDREPGTGNRKPGTGNGRPATGDVPQSVVDPGPSVATEVVIARGPEEAVRAWVVMPSLLLALKAIAVAAVVTLPLALLDVDAFIRSAVLLQLREPFRLDSLSFTRMFVAYGWPLDKQGAMYVSLAAGLAGIGLAWWRAPRTPAGFAASLGVTCFLLTAFGKKAFLNYYFLVVAALLIAVAAGRGTSPAATTRTSEPRTL